mmetsp:Transcript_43486/g.78126  ORF Transcript_43486/g.78126 Transcript_43486/m.78126 type:complete len:224 (+) Transcript_43486:356-1027(+)
MLGRVGLKLSASSGLGRGSGRPPKQAIRSSTMSTVLMANCEASRNRRRWTRTELMSRLLWGVSQPSSMASARWVKAASKFSRRCSRKQSSFRMGGRICGASGRGGSAWYGRWAANCRHWTAFWWASMSVKWARSKAPSLMYCMAILLYCLDTSAKKRAMDSQSPTLWAWAMASPRACTLISCCTLWAVRRATERSLRILLPCEGRDRLASARARRRGDRPSPS